MLYQLVVSISKSNKNNIIRRIEITDNFFGVVKITQVTDCKEVTLLFLQRLPLKKIAVILAQLLK